MSLLPFVLGKYGTTLGVLFSGWPYRISPLTVYAISVDGEGLTLTHDDVTSCREPGSFPLFKSVLPECYYLDISNKITWGLFNVTVMFHLNWF